MIQYSRALYRSSDFFAAVGYARLAMAATLLLFPGAGASSESPALRAVDDHVSAMKGWATVRADFPYRKAGRRAPDRPPVLMNAVREELEAIGSRRRQAGGRGGLQAGGRGGDVVVGGRSMGGRICSMVAAGADGLAPPERLKGVVTIAYPLHPPGKPDRLRVEHLPDVDVPWLFVHGTKDPFATPAELEEWSATVGGPVTHHWVEGKGHDLKGADTAVAAVIGEWLSAL